MAEGKSKRNSKGQYIVEDVQMGGASREPSIKFVTPIARDIEIAKSELKKIKRKELGSSGYKTKRKAPYRIKKRIFDDVLW